MTRGTEDKDLSIDSLSEIVRTFSDKLSSEDSIEEFFILDTHKISHPSGFFFDIKHGVFGSIVSDDGKFIIIDVTEKERAVLDRSADDWMIRFEKEGPVFMAKRMNEFSFSDEEDGPDL